MYVDFELSVGFAQTVLNTWIYFDEMCSFCIAIIIIVSLD